MQGRMTVDIKRWVGEQIAGVHSVRSVALNREGYLNVHTWGGSIIHVYFIDEPTKTRAIKRILQENTRVGIGTLFLIEASLIPADGSRGIPDESLIGLHALMRDKLYTYALAEGKPRIGQVHFRGYGRSDDKEVWYGPDIEIKALPCYRHSVKAPSSLRGDWQVATFGSEAFWKNTDYQVGREAFTRQQRASENVFRQHSWTNSAYTNAAGGAPGGVPTGMGPSKLDRDYATLGLPPGASCDEVKSAFRKLARELHPDVSKLPKAEARTKFEALYAAYEAVKKSISC
jgi:hypothetical protein